MIDNGLPEIAPSGQSTERFPLSTQTKSFWLLFTILGFGAFWLPLGWGILETFLALGVSWWIIYRTNLF